MTDQPEKVDLSTPDLAAMNRDALAALFPGVLADGILDATRLGELLDIPVTAPADDRERFGLMWAGKQEAVRSLLTPSRGTLVPDMERSVDFDNARNVFIEGDNLEVLKLLQKSYNDKVKLIYIDPPYNTGNDFVYNDDFGDGLRGYLEYTGQVDNEGNRLSANSETSGRRHSKWLSMIYPRLLLGRNLLQSDGAIFVSIDDNELQNLRAVMDEIYGSENFIGVFIWRKKYTLSFRDEYMIPIHEYIVAYKGRGRPVIRDPRWADETTVSVNPVFKAQNAESTKVIRAGATLQGSDTAKRFVIAKGPVKLQAQTLEYLDDAVFVDGILQSDIRVRGRYSSGQERLDTAAIQISVGGAAYVVPDEREKTIRPISILFDYTKDDASYVYERYQYRRAISTRQATAELEALMGAKVFDNPKPVELLASLIAYVKMQDGDIVLDFFAGSGTTASAVAVQNQRDGVIRHSVSVNIPESIADGKNSAFENVAQITCERIRRALAQTSEPGIRVFYLTASNFRSNEPTDGQLFDLAETTLHASQPSVDALVAEVLLGEGVSLDSRWERGFAGSSPITTASGVTVVSPEDMDVAAIEAVLDLKPRVVVFFEDVFAGKDELKANAFTRARELGITMKTV
ncbi:MAG: site-specific DNA-methyltransferase [Actinomycetia bacterium]|nr:site-specific DNA-methyltransferase [Actinomycetes bacterium]